MNPLDALAALVLEDGRRWGEAAEPWQWDDARAVLEGEIPYNFLTRARGGSKTTDLAGIMTAALLTQLPEVSASYALAADRDQGRLLVDAVEGFVRRSPVARRLEVGSWSVVNPSTRARMEVLAADAPSSWGIRPAFVVVDELAQWASTNSPKKLWEAVSTAVAKTDGKLVVLTTAGDPAHWSKKILEHAQQDALWRVNEVPGPPPWMDGERLAEQERRLPESSYRRLFWNEWTAAEDRITSESDLAACVTLDGPLDAHADRWYVIGLDLGLKNDRTVAVVCHPEDETVVLDRIQVWQGTRDRPVKLETVEEWVSQAHQTYNAARVVIDPWQAVGMAQRLRGRQVHVEEFNFSAQSVGRLATTLHLLLRDRRLALPADEELIDELANVRLRETSPGVYRMDHDPDKHDDRAVALALAAHHIESVRALGTVWAMY